MTTTPQYCGVVATEVTCLSEAAADECGDLEVLFAGRGHWLRLGFMDVPIEAWKEAPRVAWQYQFLSQHPEAADGVFPMWRSA